MLLPRVDYIPGWLSYKSYHPSDTTLEIYRHSYVDIRAVKVWL